MHPSGGDVDGGEAVHVWGQRVYEKFLYLPLNFAVNQKLLFFFKRGKGAALKKRLKKKNLFY